MGKVLQFVADGLANVLTGRGTTVDRTAHNFWVRRFSTPDQVESAYLSSWLHRKIVDVPASDMTRAGRDWDAKDEEIQKIETEEKRLGVWAKLREATRLGRLGGGAILIGLGDDPTKPLPTNIRPAHIQYLMVLSRWQLTLGELQGDLLDPNFSQPKYFRLSGAGRPIDIHPSRVVCFHGLPVPAMHTTAWEERFWGMSMVEACDEAVQQATTACTGFAALIDEAKVDVFRFSGMAETLAQSGGDDKIMKRVALTTTGKSIHRAVVLDGDDEWSQRQLTLTGVRDVIVTYDARVAGAADIPATRLFGKSPDGMNATGDGDLKNYFQSIGAKQEDDLRPAIERLDAVLLPSAGVAGDLTWQFSPLMVMDEKEQAETENKEALTLKTLVDTALFPESALAEAAANRLTESQRWPGFKEARDKALASGEMDEPDPAELDIVPIAEGGDPVVSGGGLAPARRAANDTWFATDAQPKPLYVQRKLLNAADLIAWAKAQGFKSTLPTGDMHVTVLYSRQAVDPMKLGESWSGDADGGLTIKPGGPRAVEKLGDTAVVLLFASSDLAWRHQSMVEAGGSHDFDEYQPHVTISYEVPEGMDLAAIKPFTGELRFGPELFEPLDLDWKSKLTEAE